MFSPVPFQSDFLVSPTPEPNNEPKNDEANGGIIQRKSVIASLQGFLEGSINRFLRPNDVSLIFVDRESCGSEAFLNAGKRVS